MSVIKNHRTCENGHQFIKTSNCLVCPKCAATNKPKGGLLSLLAAPARRALVNVNITNVGDLTKYTADEIHSLHGIGSSAMTVLSRELKNAGLNFKEL